MTRQVEQGGGRFPVATGAEARVTAAMLGRPGGPALEWIEAQPAGQPRGAPLLFVHGAFGAAWIWQEVFLPHLARRGRRAAAFSLRGHGRSQGGRALRSASLTDYLDDLRLAAGQWAEPPVVIGHSLGALLAQRLIGQVPMRALVLLAPLPPDGLTLVGTRIALTDPGFWFEALAGSLLPGREPAVALSRHWLFSEGLPLDRAQRYAARMSAESPVALAEAHWPVLPLSAAFAGLPAFVIGGALDRMIWPATTWRTALYHGAEHRTVPDIAHFLQLDFGAEGVARLMLDWLDERGL
ncbi:alpha/beta fold hydrolase [Methylobacterium isbiliense]|jgi:pimeloyl-ACP methyl ester carboxylesterase|uniref:2-succinyl-6-hydroxy-2, 4-cyclohexadiene-1-carboxylate synthase n=1 Tax=Methylobacterium isbiliense TaxID=315478 RepID=A0ABQ4S8B8_9HYPH|nr:alpha/beta fold hydrolase [Methylobacterium isbiliense]MDN3622058.1 alpha/beta fold hydrolase [Methylobacterium isbiliense]GJD99428.1 2-succinyl-6-hydroxy-2, 4-cyclohexadiene-1-carboxylate synthase [Methylobacterium isbiliense]